MVLWLYSDPANSTAKYSDLVPGRKCLPGLSLMILSTLAIYGLASVFSPLLVIGLENVVSPTSGSVISLAYVTGCRHCPFPMAAY